MKTIKFKMHCRTGFVGADYEDSEEIEFEDDATEEDIQKELDAVTMDWALSRVDIYFEITES